jgi:hypothetical protein
MVLGKFLWEVEALPSLELDRWKAYHAVEPIPPPGWFEAQICQVLANVNRKEGARPFRVEDFMPQGRKKDRTQSVDEVKAIIGRARGSI